MRSHSAFAFGIAILFCGHAAEASERVIGGPCDGCEDVFEGLPAQVDSRARIAPVNEPGDPMVIEGVVRTAAGTPAPGIIVYAYHTNSLGIYPPGATRHGKLRGWARTDENGRYRFDTIRPGPYPLLNNPAHVHMHIIEPGKFAYTIDDIHFDDDPLVAGMQRQDLGRGRGGDGLCHPTKDATGTWTVHRDIVLGANVHGYQ